MTFMFVKKIDLRNRREIAEGILSIRIISSIVLLLLIINVTGAL